MTWLRIKNWERHQHYKDRRPPWIKLHQSLLDDYEFSRLQDASKAHLMLIWLLASREDGRVRNDATWIGQRICATSPVDVQALVESGLLVLEHDTSGALATREQVAPRGRGETEAETEPSAAGEPFADLLARVANPQAFVGERNAMLGGMPGHIAASPEQVDRAAADLLANTAPGQPIGMAAFRKFVERELADGNRKTFRKVSGGMTIAFDPEKAY
jgi:hypothetical protein